MKKALKVAFLALFAVLSVNAGYDVQQYHQSRKAGQFVVDQVKKNPQVKLVTVGKCVRLDDTWICDAHAEAVDGEEFGAYLPVPESKIR